VGSPRRLLLHPHGFAIWDFTEQEAEEYAELMKQTFIQHYKNKKSQRI
jgi:hypothetical protein